MKNIKRFDEFSEELDESYYSPYYSDYGGSRGYEPPNVMSGFKNTFGQGKGPGDLFGAGGALSRDRSGKPDIGKGISSIKKNIMTRAGQKKGFLDHLLGRGGSTRPGADADLDPATGSSSVSRLRGASSGAAAAASSGSATPPTPKGVSPASVPAGVGIATSDGLWKGLVAALGGISPAPDVQERSSSIQGLPGGKTSEIWWSRGMPGSKGIKDWDKFPLQILISNVNVVGRRGDVTVFVDTTGKDEHNSQDMSMAERIDEFWRKKNYQVAGPKKDVQGNPRTSPSKYALVKVYFDLRSPGALKSDLQEMISKFKK